jgi:acyl carrier protein
MLTENAIKEKLFHFIEKSSNFDVNKLSEQTLLFSEGVFDSMGFILLIDFIEDQFIIKTIDEDLIEDNFESIAAITAFIQKKITAKAA